MMLRIKKIIKEISSDNLIVTSTEDEKFMKKLGKTDERYQQITKALLDI